MGGSAVEEGLLSDNRGRDVKGFRWFGAVARTDTARRGPATNSVFAGKAVEWDRHPVREFRRRLHTWPSPTPLSSVGYPTHNEIEFEGSLASACEISDR